MTKLAAQVERMAASAEKLEQSYSTQVDVVQKLASAVGQINVQNATQGIETLNKSLSGMQEKMKDTGKISESTFQKLGKIVDTVGGALKNKFPKSVAIAVGALSGFVQGVRNLTALSKGVIGFTTSFVSGLTNIAVSIIAIPFKIFEGLIDLAAKSGNGMNELAEAIEKLRKQFGALTGPTNKAIFSTSKELRGFSDTGLSAWRVFGTLAERLDYIRELAVEMGGTFGKVRQEFEDNGGALLAYQKGLGISNEDMKGVARQAISMGNKTTVALKDMTKYSYELGDAFGLDAKLISRDMSKALTDVKHFGGATVKQIAEASTYARKLGLELKDITGTLDAFETFDTAAENAAKLSQAFGVNIDAFQLMEAQDPAAQIDMLRKSFRNAGIDASNFNRQQLKLVSGTTGLDESTVKMALSLKNQGASMNEIQKKSGEAEKKTMTQAESMARLADAIERMVKSGGAQTGGFWDMFVKGFLGGIQKSKEFQTIIWNIKKALQETYMQGVRLGRAFVEMFPGVKDFLGGIADFFQPAKFKKLVGGVVDVLEDWMKGLTNNDGKGSFSALMSKIQEKFLNFFDAETPAGKQTIEGFRKFFKTFITVVAEGIKMLIPKITEGLKTLTQLISDPGKFMASAKKAGGGAGFIVELFEPIIKLFDNPEMWNGLWRAIKGFASVLWDKFADLLVKAVKEMPLKVWGAVALVMFGPALGRALLGAGISAVGEVIKKIFVQSAQKALIDKAVEASFQKATSTLVEKGVSAASATATDAVAKSATSAATSGAPQAGKLASLLANPYVLVAAAAVAITVGAFALAKTSMKNESEKLQDAMDDEEFLDKLKDKNNTINDRIKVLKQERLKQAKKADDEAGIGILYYLRGGHQSEQEADARAKMESINKQLQDAKLQADRELIIGTPEYQAKMAAAAAENKKRILDAMGPVTIENAAERFKKVSDLAKQVTGKDFDLADKMKMIRDKLDGVDFAVFGNKDKEDKLNLALSALSSVKALFGVIADVGSLSGKATSSIKSIDNKALKSAFESFDSFSNVLVIGLVNEDLIKKIQAAARNAESISTGTTSLSNNLSSTFKAVSEISTSMKSIQANALSDSDRQSSANAILGLVNNINLAVGDIGNASVIDQTKLANLGNIKTMFTQFTDVGKAAKGFSQEIASGGLHTAFKAIGTMVKAANDLNDALSNGEINKIDIKTKLERVATAVGLGGKASYTVNPSKEVQVTINLHVTMDADKVERVIIERSQSIIRDRINFATNSPSEKGNSQISDTFGTTPREINSAGTKN